MKNPRQRLYRLVAALMALGLAGSACGGSDSDVQVVAPAGENMLDASVLSGEAAVIGGGTFDLATLAGNDLVVWFWAPW